MNLEEGLARALEGPKSAPQPQMTYPVQPYGQQMIPMAPMHHAPTYTPAHIKDIDRMVQRPIARIQPAFRNDVKVPGKTLAQLAEMMNE